ncbi:MAG: cytochrome b/b6 domain-containing protein [Raoultibacter sp.]
MERFIKRHSLQARITHDVTIICCILLALSGLVVFVPAIAAALPAELVFAIRISHRVIGVVFVVVPIVSAIMAPKGVKHILKNYFVKWDSDDVTFMKRFVPYMLGPKRVHMPDQHEVKSGQRFADGVLFLAGFLIGISGIFLLLGTTVFVFDATFMLVMRFIHDIAFFMLAIFGIAHIFLGAGIFQPYRGIARTMFGDGKVSESDALYHWGHWAREEIESGENIVCEEEKTQKK